MIKVILKKYSGVTRLRKIDKTLTQLLLLCFLLLLLKLQTVTTYNQYCFKAALIIVFYIKSTIEIFNLHALYSF